MIEYVFGLAVRALIVDEEGKILILKRSTNTKTNPGRWELPGGKVDQGESFDHALIREAYEETNLKIALDHVVGVSEQNLPLIRAVHIIMSGKIVEGELNLSSEHDGYAWIYFEDLPDYELADYLQDFVMNQTKIRSEDSRDQNKDKKDSERVIDPYLSSIKDSVDNIFKKR